jgi:hypothetical protein
MQQYVQLVALQDPGWLFQQSSSSSTSKASKGGSNLGGPVFSTLMGSSRACSSQETPVRWSGHGCSKLPS